MEYLDGVTLNEFLKENEMDTQSSLEVISHVCAALKDVHKAGIVHRDVSPDNIFICTNGAVKLIDFGAARFSLDSDQQMTIILKPGFAPPEQYERVNVQGPWTDIYALRSPAKSPTNPQIDASKTLLRPIDKYAQDITENPEAAMEREVGLL